MERKLKVPERMALKQLRETNKKTVAEVATTLGVANNTYYNYERGVRLVNIAQVLKLATLFDCSAAEVINAQLNSCSCR